MHPLRVFGAGPLADHLRRGIETDVPAAAVVPDMSGATSAVPVHLLGDEEIASIFEAPMRGVITALQSAFHAECQRIIVLVPTTSMSGGAQYAAVAALAESARVLVKSAARQWGHRGVTVNAVAVEPGWFAIDPRVSGPVSIAAPALLDAGDVERVRNGGSPDSISLLDPVPLVTWLGSRASGGTTGQTVVCDGGQWM